jgi:uncharacterized repeat protein (TIGR01451 family)
MLFKKQTTMNFLQKTLFYIGFICLLSPQLRAQQTWQAVQMPSESPVSALIKIKGIYFSYNHQGIFKSRDAQNWTRITPFGNFQLLQEADTLYAVYTTGINLQQSSFIGFTNNIEGLTKQLWQSKDLGLTWKKINLSSSFGGSKPKNFNGDLIISGGKIFAKSSLSYYRNILFEKSCDTCSFKPIYEITAIFNIFKMRQGNILLITDIANSYGEQPTARSVEVINKDNLTRQSVTRMSPVYTNFYVNGDSLFATKDGDYAHKYYSLDTGKTFVKSAQLLGYLPKSSGYYYKMGTNLDATIVTRTKDFIAFDTIKRAFPFTAQYPDLNAEKTLISSFGDTLFLANHDNLFYSTDNAKTWASKNKGLSGNAYTPYVLSKRNEFLISNNKYLKYKNTDDWQLPRVKDADYALHFPNRDAYLQYIDDARKTYARTNNSYITKVNTTTQPYYWENAGSNSLDTLLWFSPQETFLGIFQNKVYTYYLNSIYVYSGSGSRKLMYNYYAGYTPGVLMTDKIFVLYSGKKFHILTDSKDDAFKLIDITGDFPTYTFITPNVDNKLFMHKNKIVSVFNGDAKSFQIRFSADTCKSWTNVHSKPFFSDKKINSVEIEKDFIWVATTTLDKSRSAVYQSDDLGNSWTRVFEDNFGREAAQVVHFNDSLYVSLSPQRLGAPYLDYWHPNNGNLPVEMVYRKGLADLREVALTPTTQGLVFHDKNNNGTKEDAETPLSNFVVKRSEAVALTKQNGYYDFENFAGQGDTLRVILQNKYMTAKPSFYLTTGTDTARNFAVTIPDVYDYKTDLDKIAEFVPGFKGSLVICVKNEGTQTDNVEVALNVDDKVDFETALPDFSRINGTRKLIYWQINNLKPNEFKLIKIKFNIPSTLPLSTPLQFVAQTKLQSQTDVNPRDNADTLAFKVVSSYDPNDKLVEPKTLTEKNIAQGDTINYTIRFQNTGDYPATKVVVTDTLGDYFDIGSFRYVSSSHDCVVDFKDKGILSFTFNNINLADSTRDENGSHGFIKFSIVPKKTLKKGNIILNKASIYFDYNAPITTPTNKLTIENLTAIKQIAQSNDALKIYPNVATNVLNYTLNEANFDAEQVCIYDLNGQLILTKKINQPSGDINTNNLPQGQYLLTIKGKNNKVFAAFFIKVN